MIAPVGWDVETALLCLCARRSAQSARVVVANEDSAAVDWDRLLAIAARHGVSGLLLAPLRSSALPVPAGIVDRLETHHIEVTGQNLKLTMQLVELLALLARHDIRALAFKGPTLAAGPYGHLGRRLSNDLDILVDRSQVSRACELMLADGYRQLPRRRQRVGSLLRGLYSGAGRDETLLPGRESRVPVDVHVA